MSGRASELGQTACIQVTTRARHPETGEVRTFPTPCDVPTGWIRMDGSGSSGPPAGRNRTLENLLISVRQEAGRVPGMDSRELTELVRQAASTFRRLTRQGTPPRQAAERTRQMIRQTAGRARILPASTSAGQVLRFAVPLAIFIGGGLALSKYG